jgi:hypothetical protein
MSTLSPQPWSTNNQQNIHKRGREEIREKEEDEGETRGDKLK